MTLPTKSDGDELSAAEYNVIKNATNALVNVLDYGADPTGVATSTAAFTAAIAVVKGTTSNGPYRGIYVPAGTYLIDATLALPEGVFRIIGDYEFGTVIKLKDAANVSLFEVDKACVASFERLYLDGNKANQTAGTSHGIHFLPHTSYVTAGTVSYCQIVGFRSSGIYGDRFRNQLYVEHTDIRSCTGSNIVQTVDAVDWFFSDCEFGGSGAYGADINGLVQITNCTFYGNAESGLKMGFRLRYSAIVNCQFDLNQKHGIEVVGTSAQAGALVIMACRFNDNSQGADNTYDHINLTSAKGTIIMGNTFLDTQTVSSVQPRYLVYVDTATTTDVTFSGNYVRTGSYKTAVVNDFTAFGSRQWGYHVFNQGVGSRNLALRRSSLSIVSGTPSSNAAVGELRFQGQDGFFGEVRDGAALLGRQVGDWNNADPEYAPTEVILRLQDATVNDNFVNDLFRWHPVRGFVTTLGVDMEGTTSAFKPPRLTTAQRDALTPTAGDVVYNSTTSKLQVYSGGAWVDLH